MTAILNFDAAMTTLRQLYDGEELTALAHAAGRPTAVLAADLLALLRELEHSVQTAARSGGKRYRVGAYGRLDDVHELPPGYRLVPRGEPS